MAISFRKEALDHMSSPEQLDRAVPILRPKEWLIVLMTVFVAASLLTWSVIGQITKRVVATGLVINREGQILDVKAVSAGELATLHVKPGDFVEEGQLIARVRQTQVVQTLEAARDTLRRRLSERDGLREQIANEDEISRVYHDKQIERLEEQIGIANRVLGSTRARLSEYRRLYEEKVVTRATLGGIRERHDQAIAALAQLQSQIEQEEKRELTRQHTNEQRLTQAGDAIAVARDRVTELELHLSRSEIKAPTRGRVIEIKSQLESLLQAGMSIMSIETVGELQEVIAYVAPGDGKLVKPGQEALIAIGTLDKASDSRLHGVVRTVSEYPVTQQGIIAQLQNSVLAQTLTAKGAPYEVRISLKRDPNSSNGYAWTSARGRESQLTTGSFCQAKIVHKKVKPISLAVPLIKEFLVGA